MVGDGLGHLGRLARGRRIVAAHDALDAGELHHGARDQVGLAQVGRALGVGRVGGVEPGLRRKVAGHLHDAFCLFQRGAQRFLEHHLAQAFHVGFERLLQVLVVEELGVVQAGGHHALVAVHDVLPEGRVAVRRDEELVGQRAVLVEQREVALVHQHGVHRDLLGHGQEQLVEGAHHDRGELGQVHHFLQGLRMQLGHEPRGLLGARRLLADGRLALGLARHHERPAQHVHQRVGVGHLVRAGRQEAVPPREVARDEPCELHGDHLVAEQCQKPTNRAAELLAAAAPALRLGPGHGAHHVGQQPRQKPRNVARGRAHHGVHVFRAALVAPLQGVHVHALAAREAGGRLGGVAVRIERDLGGRPAERLLGGLRLLGHVAHDHDQAPRRGVRLHVAVRHARGVQGAAHDAGQALRRGVQVERRQLFGADLEGKGLRRHVRPPSLPRRQARRHPPRRPRRRRRREPVPPRVPDSSRSTPSRWRARAGCSPCARWPISRRARRAG